MAKSQIKSGAIISYIQMVVGIVIGLVYTPVMIRLLGQSEYGLYNTVASTISMLSILRLGFNNSYIRYFAKYKKNNDVASIYKLNGIFLLLFSVIGFISFICGSYLTSHLELVFSKGLTLDEYNIARVLMLLLTVNLSISFPMSVFSNIISANEKFVFLKLLEVIKTILGPMVSLPLLLMGRGSIGIVATTLAVSVIIDTCYVYYVLKVLKNRFVLMVPERGILKDMVIYTSFIALELLVDQINWNIDKVILGRFKGTTMVAIYSVGYSLYTYYQSFSTSISGVFTPRVHRIINEVTDKREQKKELTELFIKVGRIQFLILSLVATGVVFFGKYFIMRVWAGVEYEQSYYVAILLIISSTIALMQNLGIEIQRAEYLHQFRSIVYTIMALLNLGLSIYLCQILGAIGSALGTAISLLIANGLVMNIYYHKKCNIDIFQFWASIFSMAKGICIPVMIGIIMASIGFSSVVTFLMEIILYCVAFALSMWFLGMNIYERNLFVSFLVRLKKMI